MRLMVLVATLMLTACLPEDPPTGAEDFASYCAACHGVSGRGDGEMAATLDRRPADLTGLAARNGGVFPTTRVMAKIWGYAGGRQGTAAMPNFGPLLESDLVPYDGGDGIETPTPTRLVQIAEYLKRIQG
jgi:mono/diheme cytochrome c family protein